MPPSCPRIRFPRDALQIVLYARPMPHFLQYWKNYQPGQFLAVSASKQFVRRKISVGDTLWLVTLLDKRLTLLGNMTIHEFVDPGEARRRFGRNLYPADTYAIPTQMPAGPIVETDISAIARKMRFNAASDRFRFGPSNPLGRQLQSMRLLTAETAALLAACQKKKDDATLTPVANDWVPLVNGGSSNPKRSLHQIYRVIRDTELCKHLKLLHKHRCQLCGQSITLRDGTQYSEAHHIRPLGTPHHGSDLRENILIVCPNHHVMLDYGVIELSLSSITKSRHHRISRKSIDYHNSLCRVPRS